MGAGVDDECLNEGGKGHHTRAPRPNLDLDWTWTGPEPEPDTHTLTHSLTHKVGLVGYVPTVVLRPGHTPKTPRHQPASQRARPLANLLARSPTC